MQNFQFVHLLFHFVYDILLNTLTDSIPMNTQLLQISSTHQPKGTKELRTAVKLIRFLFCQRIKPASQKLCNKRIFTSNIYRSRNHRK